MILYPAIDIRGGECVRLSQGSFDAVTVYEKDPVQAALLWQEAGASWIHTVDLDGALSGRAVNLEVLKRIVRAVKIPVQNGGGVRKMEHVEEKLSIGLARVIIGTAAVKDPDFLARALKEYGPERIAVGIDAKDGKVATEGWENVSRISAVELGKKMKAMGLKYAVYTDISRDGMLCGPNIPATCEMMEQTGLTVIASGGISSMEDLEALAQAGVYGAITGKALYEKRIDLAQAVRKLERKEEI